MVAVTCPFHLLYLNDWRGTVRMEKLQNACNDISCKTHFISSITTRWSQPFYSFVTQFFKKRRKRNWLRIIQMIWRKVLGTWFWKTAKFAEGIHSKYCKKVHSFRESGRRRKYPELCKRAMMISVPAFNVTGHSKVSQLAPGLNQCWGLLILLDVQKNNFNQIHSKVIFIENQYPYHYKQY